MSRTRLTAESLEAREVPAGPLLDLHSRPGVPWQIVLDPWGDAGETMAGTVWQIFGTIPTPAYDTDGNPGAFSAAELEQLAAVHEQVSDDFRPFDVDVTLGPPTVPLGRYQRVKVGGRGAWYSPTPTVSGVTASRFGQVSLFGGKDSPLYVFSGLLDTPANVAGVISHELGHALGLSHDGTATAEYYPGAGAWAPLMGAPFKALTQWSDGGYPGATNRQDDTAIIAATLGLRPDDFGDSYDVAALLLSGQPKTGVVGTRADVDAFRFTSGAGPVSVSFAGAVGGNLYARVSLYDAAGKLLAQGDGTTAALTASVPGGTYYVTIDGVAGPAPNDYGSLGQYRLTVTAAPEEIPPPPPPPTGTAGATPPAATVAVSSPVPRAEGDGGQYLGSIQTFTVSLSRWLPYPVTVAVRTVPGTATAGADYTEVVRTLTFNPGVQALPVQVYVWGDRLGEPDETLWLEITSVSVGTVAGAGARGTATVRDDDGANWQFGPLFLPPDGSGQGVRR